MKTKGELVKELGLENFDYALPQGWVNYWAERGFDTVPHFVWSYEHLAGGGPYPITPTGLQMLMQMALFVKY